MTATQHIHTGHLMLSISLAFSLWDFGWQQTKMAPIKNTYQSIKKKYIFVFWMYSMHIFIVFLSFWRIWLANCIANIIPTEGDFFCLFSVDANVCLKIMTADMKKAWKTTVLSTLITVFGDQHDSSFSDLKFWIIKVLAFLGSFFGIKFRFGDLKVLEYIWPK